MKEDTNENLKSQKNISQSIIDTDTGNDNFYTFVIRC